MIYADVIIVGGGPAGASCARKLKQKGLNCLVLDKQSFPRPKLCAGWITPQVLKDLEIEVKDYPLSLTEFNRFHIHIYKKEICLPVHQYAIRRYEFDDWLLKRAGVAVKTHDVKSVKKAGNYYVIDDQFHCRYLVGAGGTYCPVYRTFFKPSHPRAKDSLIATLEAEFHYDYQDDDCHLWFLFNQLPGYAWYVPKDNGYLNIGIGGFLERLKANNDNIKDQWQVFTRELARLSLVKKLPCAAKGYVYYIRNSVDTFQKERIFLIGDAAGLATKDMGEGIGPAIWSGRLAADAIASGKRYSLQEIKKQSFTKFCILTKLLQHYLFH